MLTACSLSNASIIPSMDHKISTGVARLQIDFPHPRSPAGWYDGSFGPPMPCLRPREVYRQAAHPAAEVDKPEEVERNHAWRTLRILPDMDLADNLGRIEAGTSLDSAPSNDDKATAVSLS